MFKYVEKGKRLRLFIEDRKWSKAEFARRMRIPQQNVNRYLSGELDPMNLAEELLREGCILEWLMTGKKADKGEFLVHVGDDGSIKMPGGLPEKTQKQLRVLIEELGKLDDTDIDKVREIVRTIFKPKKKRG